MTDIKSPNLSLLVKLGSIAVHANGLLSPEGHHFDKAALQSLLDDAEVTQWLANMDKQTFLPKRRKP